MLEYPKMLYKDGNQYDVEGVMVDIEIVEDLETETLYLSDGWRLNAEKPKAKVKTKTEVSSDEN